MIEQTDLQQYLPPEKQEEISKDLVQAIDISKSLQVTSEEKMNEANSYAGKIRARQKGLESFRLAIVAPIKTHLAKIDKFFKDLQKGFDEPLDRLEKKVISYRESRKVSPAKTTYQENVGRTSFVKDAAFTITDKDLIPDDFWVVDESRIRARAKELIKDLNPGEYNEKSIPGVKVQAVERAVYTGEK